MTKLISVALATLAIVFVAYPTKLETPPAHVETVQPLSELKIEIPEPKKPLLNHQQEVWLYVLEWCESRGVKTAINEVDRDGTASYYSFQFKPGTFLSYGLKYGLIPATTSPSELHEKLKDYDLQKDIVTRMILDSSIDWYQQFPDCVRKHGRPPR